MMKKYIKRELYLSSLRSLQDKHIIKVITGIRRCGKSVLLKTFRDELKEQHIADNAIQVYNFEEPEHHIYSDWLELYTTIKTKLIPDTMNYIFLDEVQNIKEFEKLVDGLFVQDNVDLYITGSNAYMLSGKLATLLSGRYIEIHVLPFSFAEYLEYIGDKTDLQLKFADFMKNGGMPQSIEMFAESQSIGIDYLRGIYMTVILKDIMTREGINDIETLENIVRYLFDTVGSLVSPTNIANYMKAHHKTIDSRKVEKILTALHDAFIVYGVNRFDVRGKENLKTLQKQYLVDTGLQQLLISKKEGVDNAKLLENIVYLELIRRGYHITIGKNNDKEIDFVAKTSTGEIEYYQVSLTVRDPKTLQRELGGFDTKDNYKKILITADPEENNYNGITQINIINWLLNHQK